MHGIVKNVLWLTAALATLGGGLFACAASSASGPNETVTATGTKIAGAPLEPRDGEKLVRLQIEGMRCGGCIASARKVLQGFPEVRAAEVDVDSGLATVVARSDADPNVWIRALTEPENSPGKSMGWRVSVLAPGASPVTLASARPSVAPSVAADLTPADGEKIVRIRIEGIRCGGCVTRAQGILQGFPEIRAAHVDLASGIATVVARVEADPAPWLRAMAESKRSNGTPTGWTAELVTP